MRESRESRAQGFAVLFFSFFLLVMAEQLVEKLCLRVVFCALSPTKMLLVERSGDSLAQNDNRQNTSRQLNTSLPL